MKIKRMLRTAAEVLLILMLASGVRAATLVLDETDFMSGTKTRMFPFGFIEGGNLKATLPDFEFLPSSDVLALAISKGKKIVGPTLLGSGIFNFQDDSVIFSDDVLGVAGGESDLSLSRLQVSYDKPIPTAAILILIGLIALIALKRWRKK